MFDPDGVILTKENLSNHINIQEVPEYDFDVYDLEDDKSFKNYINHIKNMVRRSREYRKLINYLRLYAGMDQCAYLQNATNKENFKIKIEVHHYPFTIEDIIRVVYKKRKYYHESLDVPMIAKEVMILHYLLMVGLISLSATIHKLVHNGKLFIPVDKVFGRYELFVQNYKPFCTPEMIEVLGRIEQYTEEQSRLLDTTILNENHVTLNIKDQNYQLPDLNNVNRAMQFQIKSIKDNGYQIPTVRDNPKIEKKENPKIPTSGIHFLERIEIKKVG